MKNKEKLFRLLDKVRIKLFYSLAIFAVIFLVSLKIFYFLAYNLILINQIVLSVIIILTGLIYLSEGVYLRKLLVVGKTGAYDYYYKKSAIIQGILLFFICLSLSLLILFHTKLFAILLASFLLLSILLHYILGSGK